MNQTEALRMKSRPPLVPLATLLGRELRSEKVETPTIKYGHAALAKKGEDYFLTKPDCQRIPGNPATSFSVFGVDLIPFDLTFTCVHFVFMNFNKS